MDEDKDKLNEEKNIYISQNRDKAINGSDNTEKSEREDTSVPGIKINSPESREKRIEPEPEKSYPGETFVKTVRNEDKNRKAEIKPGFIVLIAVICAVIGAVTGIFGYRLTEKHYAEKEPQSQQTAEEKYEDDADLTDTDSGNKINSVFNSSDNSQNSNSDSERQTASSDGNMSASSVYSANIGSCVGITTKTESGEAMGSGFFISNDGYIVTNYHVVSGGQSFQVITSDKTSVSAEIVGYDETDDIAVLKTNISNSKPVTFGKSSDLKIGDSVYVIGNPLGDLTFTLTAGVVSATNRLIKVASGNTINMFQTDAAINSGNSGGPVFDSNGKVIGIATAKYSNVSIEGLSFCIPIDDVSDIISQLKEKGYVAGRPYLGAAVYDTISSQRLFFNVTSSIDGAAVSQVYHGTAAESAGLKSGDIITYFEGEKVSSVSVLKSYLSVFSSGDKVQITVNRNGSAVTLNITLGEYSPSSVPTATDGSYVL